MRACVRAHARVITGAVCVLARVLACVLNLSLSFCVSVCKTSHHSISRVHALIRIYLCVTLCVRARATHYEDCLCVKVRACPHCAPAHIATVRGRTCASTKGLFKWHTETASEFQPAAGLFLLSSRLARQPILRIPVHCLFRTSKLGLF